MRTRLLIICLLPLALATVAACTTSDDGDGVATVAGSAAPSVTPSVSLLDQLIKYTQCMREHGIPIGDPRLVENTYLQGRIEAGFDKDKVDAAEAVCKQYRPPQEVGPAMDLKKELSRQEARCMREHGVENFPDPNPDGPTRISEEVGNDPQYPEAKDFCRAQTDAALASMRPSPGTTR
jgi:hypothetical protein